MRQIKNKTTMCGIIQECPREMGHQTSQGRSLRRIMKTTNLSFKAVVNRLTFGKMKSRFFWKSTFFYVQANKFTKPM